MHGANDAAANCLNRPEIPMAKTPLGRLPQDAIRMLELPRLAPDILHGYQALVDLSGTVSDALDELGIVGVVPAYLLPPATRACVSSGSHPRSNNCAGMPT